MDGAAGASADGSTEAAGPVVTPAGSVGTENISSGLASPAVAAGAVSSVPCAGKRSPDAGPCAVTGASLAAALAPGVAAPGGATLDVAAPGVAAWPVPPLGRAGATGSAGKAGCWAAELLAAAGAPPGGLSGPAVGAAERFAKGVAEARALPSEAAAAGTDKSGGKAKMSESLDPGGTAKTD
jgi:hypothetical protein